MTLRALPVVPPIVLFAPVIWIPVKFADAALLHDPAVYVEACSYLDANDVTYLDRNAVVRAFHYGIYRGSGNVVLLQELDSLWTRSERYGMVAQGSGDFDIERETREHWELYDAIERRDARGAERAMQKHATSVLAPVVKALQR